MAETAITTAARKILENNQPVFCATPSIPISLCLCLNIYLSVVTKTITITKKAYEALAKEKRRGESFSELTIRLTKRGRIKDCFGTWKMTEDEVRIFSSLENAWKATDEEFKRRLGVA